VVLGSVLTEDGGRGCNGEVWLQPAGAPVRDVRSIAAARLQNMFRFPQLLPGRYELGVRCFGYQAVRRTVEVRIGQVWRAVVTMHPIPERIAGGHAEAPAQAGASSYRVLPITAGWNPAASPPHSPVR
jgi:hypothetical protein